MAAESPEQPDPRRRRAFIAGGVLLAAILVWNADWRGGDDHGVSISLNDDETAADEAPDRVRSEVRDRIRDVVRGEAGDAVDRAETDAAGARTEADHLAAEPSDAGRTIRIEGDGGDGVTINLPAESRR